MKNKNNIILYNISLYIIIFISILNKINSVNFFPLENAKEEPSLNNSFLKLEIKGVVSSAVNKNLSFSIESELYKDNELISDKNYINCSIPKNPKAVFGTVTISKCEFDLFYTPIANKILFSKFISDINELKIEDPNNFILGQNLTFSKNLNISPNFEIIVEDLKTVKCLDNKYIFGIIGEIDRIFVSSFIFNFIINPNAYIKAKCISPYIYFTKKTMINCTIDLIKNDNNFEKELDKGIILKENYYRIINEEGEKILKIKIGNNDKKIELKELKCKEVKKDIIQIKNITEVEEDLSNNKINKTNKTDEEIERNLTKVNGENRNKSLSIDKEKDIDKNSSIIETYEESKNSSTDNNEIDFDFNKEIKITKNDTEININFNIDNITKNKTINNNTEIVNNNEEENITNIEKIEKIIITKNNTIKENDLNNITNTTENIIEKVSDIKNKVEKNFTENDNTLKNNTLNDTENEFEQEKIKQNNESTENQINKTSEDNESLIINTNNENLTNTTNITKEIQIGEKVNINSNTRNYSIENITTYNSLKETDLQNNIIKNNSNFENNTDIITDEEISDSTNLEKRQVDDYTRMWELIRNRGKSKKQKERAEIEREERRQREWERKREEERKKREEEEKQKEEERQRKEQEEKQIEEERKRNEKKK